MIDVATLSVIRRWALREQMSIREISRRTGLSRNTIRKYLRAHFSDRGRLFQSDRGRRFSVIVDAPGCAQAMGFNVSQSSTIRLAYSGERDR
ncbi:protein of unknown function [Thiomonas sp. Sup16B3]|nr:protein of unknown function [Thiomonas sp. Sup16B3]